jgi:hypothetical protein
MQANALIGSIRQQLLAMGSERVYPKAPPRNEQH